MTKHEEIIIGRPMPDGDYWKFTRRAADGLDAANLKIVSGLPEEEDAEEEAKGDDETAGESD